jgi:hypothetical protein
MPKGPHEALHHLFRDDPDLVRRALKTCLSEDFPPFREVLVLDSDVTEIRAINREVDTALRVETVEGAEILIVEPQSTPPTQAKRRSWHWYLSYFETHYDVPASLLILTADQTCAEACRRPMTLGPDRRASATIHPYVIGPDNTPLIVDPAQARDDVMLAVMAALAHRLDPCIGAALDALAEALDTIDLETAKFFAEYVEVGLGEGGIRDLWKGIIMTMTYPYASELRRELTESGRMEGRAEGRADALLSLLTLRGITVTDTQRERVLACSDEEEFLRWLGRATSANSADEVFGTD